MTISTGSEELAADSPARGTRPPARTAGRRRAAASVLSALLSIILGIAALASCAPSSPTLKTPTATVYSVPTATPRGKETPRLVYQADWSHGLDGWKATPGWTLSGGVLQSDLGADRELTSPFRPATPNYALEFHLQLVGVAQNAATEYTVSADPTGGKDGYVAQVDNVMLHPCMFACHPHLVIFIDPMADQLGGVGAGSYSPSSGAYEIHDFEPGTRLLTYRVEVRGPDTWLLIDGHVFSWAHGIKTAQLSNGPIRFYCTGVQLRLSDFKVYSL